MYPLYYIVFNLFYFILFKCKNFICIGKRYFDLFKKFLDAKFQIIFLVV